MKHTLTETIRGWFGWNVQYYPQQSSTYDILTSGSNLPFVGAATALTFTPVYRAINLISNDVSRCRAEFTSPTNERIWNRPNKYQSGYDFRRQMTANVLLYGNAFALINRKKSGEVYEILPLPAGSVSLKTSGKEPVYTHSAYGDIKLDDMLHLKASPIDGLWAESPIMLCRTAVGIGLNQENNVLQQSNNGGVPNLAFIVPSQMNVAGRQAMVNDYLKNHTGKNAGKPLVLSENARIEKLTSTSVASDLETARKYSIADVSRIYGIPTSYLAENSGTNAYGSIEWLSRMYLDSCLSHWFEVWRSEFELKLGEGPLFDTDLITRPPLAEFFAALRTGVEASIITPNEAREMMDYDPIEGGDDRIVAMNMGEGGGKTNKGNDTSGGVAQGDIQ